MIDRPKCFGILYTERTLPDQQSCVFCAIVDECKKRTLSKCYGQLHGQREECQFCSKNSECILEVKRRQIENAPEPYPIALELELPEQEVIENPGKKYKIKAKDKKSEIFEVMNVLIDGDMTIEEIEEKFKKRGKSKSRIREYIACIASISDVRVSKGGKIKLFDQ